MRFVIPLILLLAACADPYGDAQEANTVEAWEGFLKTEPSASQKMFAEQRIEEILVRRAEESKTVADWAAVLKRFPTSKDKKKYIENKLNASMKLASMKLAEAANTEEAWKKVAEENPEADPAILKEARARADMAAYAAMLVIAEPVVKQINLAEDPKGPLNGWGIFTEVTNTGDKTVSYLNLDCEYLDAGGQPIRGDKWPVVGISGPGGVSMHDDFYKPMKPGEKRPWALTTGEPPANWGQKVKLTAVSVRFAKEGG
jgi:hypothetical protein